MILKSVPATREHLLESAFCDIPQKIGSITLRPLSGKSFTTLGSLGCPLITSEATDQKAMIEGTILYAWMHSAPIEIVSAVETLADVPKQELSLLGYNISLGEIFAFLAAFKKTSARLAAALAEIEEDEEPGKQETASPAGLHPSCSPSELPEIQSESDTSFGKCPSNEPSVISTPPISPTEPSADGLVPLPILTNHQE